MPFRIGVPVELSFYLQPFPNRDAALLVARRTNNRKVVGSRPAKVVCISVIYHGVLPADCTVCVRRWRSLSFTLVNWHSAASVQIPTSHWRYVVVNVNCFGVPAAARSPCDPCWTCDSPAPLSPRPSTADYRANAAFRSFPDTLCRRFLRRLRVGRCASLTNDWLDCGTQAYIVIFVYIRVYFCMCQLLCSFVLDVTSSVCVWASKNCNDSARLANSKTPSLVQKSGTYLKCELSYGKFCVKNCKFSLPLQHGFVGHKFHSHS